VKELKIRNTEFYTYKQKPGRNFKIVLKYMLPQEKVGAIRKEFGYKLTNIWNIKKRGTKVKLNIFYVDLKPENKDIYEVTHVLCYTVKFEFHTQIAKSHIVLTASDTAIQKTSGIKKRIASSVQETSQLSTAHAKLNPRMSNACYAKATT